MHQRSQCAASAREPSKEEVVSSTASIVKSDAAEFLLSLSECPRLILTDPPYGMNYKSNMPGDKRWNSTGVTLAARRGLPELKIMQGDTPGALDFKAFYEAAYDALDSGYLVVFGSWESLRLWEGLIKEVGFHVQEPLTWDKKDSIGGDLRLPFGRATEYILYCRKGNAPTYPIYNAKGLLKKRIPNVLRYGRTPKREYVGHPTQKPLYLCSQMVRAFTDCGELVVDPFCGSASTLVAAKLIGRRVAGCDIDAEYVSMARKRLDDPRTEIIPPKFMRDRDQKRDAKPA